MSHIAPYEYDMSKHCRSLVGQSVVTYTAPWIIPLASPLPSVYGPPISLSRGSSLTCRRCSLRPCFSCTLANRCSREPLSWRLRSISAIVSNMAFSRAFCGGGREESMSFSHRHVSCTVPYGEQPGPTAGCPRAKGGVGVACSMHPPCWCTLSPSAARYGGASFAAPARLMKYPIPPAPLQPPEGHCSSGATSSSSCSPQSPCRHSSRSERDESCVQ